MMSSETITSASNYEAISRENELDLGRDRTSRMSQVAMYADTAHFVYELLQNADDAGATEIAFRVAETELVVEHNGRPFDTGDVKAISYFGKGKTDLTKIGHFGLGFKSVFAYTASPSIHSGVESFEIHDLYSLASKPYPEDLPVGRTRIVLPFDHAQRNPAYIEKRKRKSAVAARNEIATKLASLGATTLLFTDSLRDIQWTCDGREGRYLRDDSMVAANARETYIITNEDEEERYLAFSRDVDWPDEENETQQTRRRPVQIAFQLTDRLDRGGRVEPLTRPPLFVFFPTSMTLDLGFVIQGPYRTTPARDNIPADDEFNRHLIAVSAALLMDVLTTMQAMDILDLHALAALPIAASLATNAFLQPLYDRTREVLEHEPFLPTADGGHVRGTDAKIARGSELVSLFKTAQLKALFGSDEVRWIDPELTETSYPELHEYLVGKRALYSWQPSRPPLATGIEVRADDLARRVTSEFMAKQTDEWVIELYTYLSGRPKSEFADRPIIRLQSGEHVRAFNEAGAANAFLPTDEETFADLPVVKETILEDPAAREYLVDGLRLTTPDTCDIVIKDILPKFSKAGTMPVEEWREHFRLIRSALQNGSVAKRSHLVTELRRHAFLLVERAGAPEDFALASPVGAYFNTQETQTFFMPSGKYLLASEEYNEEDMKELRNLGIAEAPRVQIRRPDIYGHVVITQQHSHHVRGIDGFDPDWTMDGLEEALSSGSPEIAPLLWRYLLPLAEQSELVHGVIQRSSEQFYKNPWLVPQDAASGALIRDTPWLFDASGTARRPAELSLDELPESFERTSERARKLARQLGMRLPEQEAVIDAIFAGDERKRKIFDRLLNASDADVEKLERIFAATPAPSDQRTFREALTELQRPQRPQVPHEGASGTIHNPERYGVKLGEDLREAIEDATKPREVRLNVVRATAANAQARTFLYEQYGGRCQVSGSTFVKANGENFFEAVSLVSRLGAEHLNHAGNMLCLSAEIAAMTMHGAFAWLDDLEEKIIGFRVAAQGGMIDDRRIRIKLIGEERTITWSEQHFARLVALWKLA